MVNVFDFWESNGFRAYEKGDVRIYTVEGEDYLFVGPTLYASTSERPWYIKNVMPHAKGRVLEIGLGLGCASKVILAKPQVSHLLTIEQNENVISAFGRPLNKHNILLTDVNDWVKNIPQVNPFYDLIFVDHYTFSEETLYQLEELAIRLSPMIKEGGRMIFWVDENAPEEDKELIRRLWLTL